MWYCSNMIPTVGHVVHFHAPLDEDTEKRELVDPTMARAHQEYQHKQDRWRAQNDILRAECNGGKCVAAIIVGVHPTGCVTLDVRWPWAADYCQPSYRCRIWRDVLQGTEHATWHEPERV